MNFCLRPKKKASKTLSRPLHSKLKKIPGLFKDLHRNLRTSFKEKWNSRTFQGLFKVLSPSGKYLLKRKFCASFQRDSVFLFENIALSNFPSLIRVTLIWRPRRPSHMLKDNFIAWYYALWMVKVLENVFRGMICSFAVNNWSNLWRYWDQMFALFPAAIFVLLQMASPCRVSPINFCPIFWRTTQQRKTAQTRELARLSIYRYSIISDEILAFRHSTVLILVFDGVTVKTTNIFPRDRAP